MISRGPLARADFDFTISDEAFAYLAVQRGGLDHLKRDRAAWEAAYKASIFETYENMLPVLPERCAALLDVGGGMSGISALLNAHYGGGVAVTILDGLYDPPQVRFHSETFNCMVATGRFLQAHGVRPIRGMGCNGPPFTGRFDLVLSFAAWCFHIPPAEHLAKVRAACHPGTVAILEVRNGRPDWQVELERAFAPASAILTAAKFTRRVYVAR